MANAPQTSRPRKKSIAHRLATVRARISHVTKDAHNPEGDYQYSSWGNVLQTVRDHLDDVGLHLHVSTADVRLLAPGLLLVELDYEWQATDCDLRQPGRWAGLGWDRGDKALYKGYSGALKYLILDTFLIPTGDDPEGDPSTDRQANVTALPARTAEPPLIPRERAERIVTAAREAGLSETAWLAKLAELGARRVVDLTVDQAEGMEEFIASVAEAPPAEVAA